MEGAGMFFSFKKRMIAVIAVILVATVLLETPWQPQTRWVMEVILDNAWNWEHCAEVFSRFP
jgi:hypothetical protein